jgi:inorganic triphosphatase YgiF
MRTHVESERKYEAPPDADVPTLTTIPGVTTATDPQRIQLDATYYDTADLRLIRAGLTLRHREGGDDDGWHLKVPTDSARTEIHGDLAELADLVLGYTRGAPLRPVASLHTDRNRWELVGRRGMLLAEVTDDLF